MRGIFGQYPPNTFRLLKFIYHLPNFIRLFWQLFQDPRVPFYKKAIPILFGALSVIIATVYFVGIKFDLIPDFFPIVGMMDDIIISVVIIFFPGAWIFIKICPKDVVLEHVKQIDKKGK